MRGVRAGPGSNLGGAALWGWGMGVCVWGGVRVCVPVHASMCLFGGAGVGLCVCAYACVCVCSRGVGVCVY